MFKQLSVLAFVLFSTQKVNAQITTTTTADSPAFNNSFSIDSGFSYSTYPVNTLKSKSSTTFNKCKCAYVTTVTQYTEKSTKEKFTGYRKLNLTVLPNTFVSLGYNKELFASISSKQGPFAATVGIDSLGYKSASIAVSPIKNSALFAAYNREAMSYGIQQQINDVALNFQYTPKFEAYSFGISLNLGSKAPNLEKLVNPITKPTVEQIVKPKQPVTPVSPLNYKPWPKRPDGSFVRGRG